MKGRRLPVALGLLAVLMGMAPGNGPGQSSSCTPGVSLDVPAASTPGKPVRVQTNANVVCPTPEGPTGSTWGPTTTQPQQPHVAGTACTQVVWEPMELSLTPGGQMMVFWVNPANPGTGSDTPEPWMLNQIITGISPMAFWSQAGTTTEFFMPFRLTGTWDATGFRCLPNPKDVHGSYSEICNIAPIPVTCLGTVNNGVGNTVPPGITQMQGGTVDLRKQMLQLIHPGALTSLPAQPNQALVNLPTCFFINGADIGGQDPNQPATFEMVLLGPPDGDGRQVYYVYRIDVLLQSVDWNFGDDSQTEPLPPQCIGVSNAPLQFAHRYLHYSPPGGFAVTATETYTLHVTVYWYDGGGMPHPALDLGDLPPIQVAAGPVPALREVVVQEEGVPIG